jgi:hypothetical protein
MAKTEQDKTEEFIQWIKLQGEKLYLSAQKQALKDFVLVLDFDKENLNKSINSKVIHKLVIDKNKQTIRATLLNAFVYRICGEIYNADFNKVYSEINEDFQTLTAFNRAIAKQLRDKPKRFIDNL